MTKFTQHHTRSAKRTGTEIQEIRHKYHQLRMTQGALAREYQMSVGQIGRIVRGESWNQFPNVQGDPEITDAAIASANRLINLLEEPSNATQDNPHVPEGFVPAEPTSPPDAVSPASRYLGEEETFETDDKGERTPGTE